MTEVSNEQFCFNLLDDALRALKGNKPEERSEAARAWAVTITELEKVIAYFEKFVVNK